MDFRSAEEPLIRLAPRHLTLSSEARIYAISDVHGCWNVLEPSLELIAHDLRHNPPGRTQEVRFLKLGDTINKGPQTRRCIDAFSDFGRRMKDRVDWKDIDLIGNHEKYMIDFVNGPGVLGLDAWVKEGLQWVAFNGGFSTLKSYGLENSSLTALAGLKGQAALAEEELCGRNLEAFLLPLREEFIGRLKETSHLERFSSLGATVSSQHFVFCHAQILPDKPVSQHSIEDVIAGRDIVKYEKGFLDGKIVVYGHSGKSPPPNKKPFSIGIDPRAIKDGQPFVMRLDAEGTVRFLRAGNEQLGPYVYKHEPSPEIKPYASHGQNGSPALPQSIWRPALDRLSVQPSH